MIYLITGNGKGKTTSALGTAIRASGWDKEVAVVYFDKGGSHYGEQNILNLLQEKIQTFRFGLPRFDEAKGTFRFENTEEDRAEARRALEKSHSLIKEGSFMVVCDELINCLNLGLVEREPVEALIDAAPKEVHLILTGRNAPEWMTEKADLISEINMIKHYFQKGVKAQKGVEY
jgi:cob(I)alamin adenosyltransferase